MHHDDLRHVSFQGKPAPRAGVRGLPAARSLDAPTPPCAAPDASDAFARWVLALASLDGTAYRREVLRRRVPACLRVLKVRSEQQARARLRDHPALLPAAVGALLIGVTEFFRDPDVFDAIAARALPVLGGRPLVRVWSAGASSGAEACSMAMLLAEGGLLHRADIVGTDYRQDAIAQAREARYPAPQVPGHYRQMLDKYGHADGAGNWRPVVRIRSRMRWKVADLLQTVEAGPWDVILWRNAGMYLNPDAAAAIGRRLVAHLAPGGFLVLGKAERPPDCGALAAVHRCIFTKRSDG